MLGIIGFYMKKYDYSIIAFVIGEIAEENLDRTLQLYDGSWAIFLSPEFPLSLSLVNLIVLIVLGPIIKPHLDRLLDRT